MMMLKIIFTASGNNLIPVSLPIIRADEITMCSLNSPDDFKKYGNKTEKYGYGSISFMHKKIFGIHDELYAYEENFLKFAESNYDVLKKAGADNFEFFLEVYFSDQCNFEVFDKAMLKRIAALEISLPISVYFLTELEMLDLVKQN